MGLTLVTGAANSGKTGVVYGSVREAVARGLGPVVVVPTAPDARRARLEFSRDAAFGVRVSPVSTFLNGQWGLWGDGRAVITPAQRLVAVSECLRAAEFVVLRGSASSPGFPRFLERMASETAAFEPTELRRRGDLDEEVAALLDRYRDLLAGASLVEPGEAWRILARGNLMFDGPLVFHRFLELDPGLEAFITGSSATGDVVVSLTWVRGRAATEALDPLVQRLSDAADLHVEAVERAGEGSAELERVEAGVMASSGLIDAGGAVAFGEAAGDEAEAALVAREARRLTDEFGPGRVAVVFRNLAGRLALIVRALESQNLPFDIDVVEPVSSVPFGSALLDLLAAMTEPGDARKLTSFLVTPYAGLDRAVRERLDAAWRRTRPASAQALASSVGDAAPEAGALLRRARALAAEGVDTAGLVEWKRLLDSLLVRRYGSIPDSHDGDLARDAAAHRAAFDAVSAIVEARHGRVGMADILATLRESRAAARAFERTGHLQLVEAHRIGARRFEGVVLAGLDEGGFAPSPNGDSVEDLLGRLAPIPPVDRVLGERLVFYNAVTRARSRLVLTRRSSDADGRPVRPSPFWDEMLDFYRDPATSASVPDCVRTGAARAADVVEGAPTLSPGRTRLREDAKAGKWIRAVPAPAARGVLVDDEIRSELAARDLFSATELEKYVRCPYRWFYERTIRPEPLDGELGAMESGRLIHEVLRTFYAGALREATGAGRVDHDNLDEALQVLEAVMTAEAEKPGAIAPATLLEEHEVAKAHERCRGLVMADADFLPGAEPWLLEWEFGQAEEPVTIVDFGIHGRVDRIDRGPGMTAVMDYKRGKAPTAAEVKDGRALQVMLYAYAAERVLGGRVSTGFYRGLGSGADLAVGPRETFTLTDDGGEKVEVTYMDAALDAAVAAVAGIRAGRIPAEPIKEGSCAFCAAAGTCPRCRT